MPNFLQLISALIGIVLILFLAYYLTKLYAKKVGAMFGSGKNMKVIDRISIGKGSAVVVIELNNEQYMVGVTEQNINLLSKLEEPIEISDEPMAEPPSFIKALKQVALKKGNDEGTCNDEK